MTTYDAIIIGGGSAGLAAAIALGRSKRNVLVVDAGQPRNAVSAHAHNVLGHDGINPQELLARGRTEAASYGVAFTAETITSLGGSLEQGFTVTGAHTRWNARRIVLATGVRDILPQIPGLREAWGVSALHCPYCHGWEVRDQRIAILGVSEMSTHQALLFNQLSDEVCFINHIPEALSAENRALLEAIEVPIIDSSATSLDVDPQGQVRTLSVSNGSTVETSAVVVATRLEPNADLYLALGGELAQNPMGKFIEVDLMGATSIPGVYAAGNVANLTAMLSASATAGTMVGAAVNAELALESAKQKVAR